MPFLDTFQQSSALKRLEHSAEKIGAVFARIPARVWKGLVIFLALLWICHSISLLFWYLFPAPEIEEPKVIAAPISQSQSGAASASVDLSQLTSVNLFGEASADVLPQEVAAEENDFQNIDEENAATTALSLQLQGIIASSVADESRAIIADGSTQQLYAIGDEMPQGNRVKLAKILDSRVILDNNGRAESLWLYSEEDFKNLPSNQQRQASNGPPPGYDPTQSQGGRAARALTEATKRTVKVDPSAKDAPKSINDVVRFSVYRKDGKMQGYRVRPGRNADLFKQAGLKTGDIVTSVNGIVVDDPRKIRSVYDSLKQTSDAQLEVVRDGSPVAITISLDSGS